MPRSLTNTAESTRIDSIDVPRPQPAKAQLPVNDGQSSLRGIVSRVIRHNSSQKAAAIDMAIDPGQLTRQLQNGHLTIERLEALGPEFCAELGRQLVEVFGPLADSPSMRVRNLAQVLRQVEDELTQLADFMEGVA